MPNTKTMEKHHKNTTDQYPSWIQLQKSSKKDTNALNTATFKKDYAPWPNKIYPNNVKLA